MINEAKVHCKGGTEDIRIAILYICTGKYKIFWKDFFESVEAKFLNECYIEYFVFTDGELEAVNERVTIVECMHLGWPYDTLFRFKMFDKIRIELEQFDYLFFMNANLIIIETITQDILPVEEDLVGVIHPGFYNKMKTEFTYERRANSLAFLTFEEGEYYFMGGFNGGKASAFLKMSYELNNNIDIDLKNGFIAEWHDESHLNKYFWNHKDSLKVLDPSFGYPDGWLLPFKKRILIRDKINFGGHDFLRSK
jgi:hypothetical protein